MRIVGALLLCGLIFACGEDLSVESESEELLCSEQPKVDAKTGIATSVGCGFIQQSTNISKNGLLIAEEGVELRDRNGAVVATITHRCGRWVIGSDPQDQTVIIGMDDGEVRSHGTLHAGQELSSLSMSLALPLTY